jgi:hypothetical protein
MTHGLGPATSCRRLRHRLRQIREASGRSYDEVSTVRVAVTVDVRSIAVAALKRLT